MEGRREGGWEGESPFFDRICNVLYSIRKERESLSKGSFLAQGELTWKRVMQAVASKCLDGSGTDGQMTTTRPAAEGIEGGACDDSEDGRYTTLELLAFLFSWCHPCSLRKGAQERKESLWLLRHHFLEEGKKRRKRGFLSQKLVMAAILLLSLLSPFSILSSMALSLI